MRFRVIVTLLAAPSLLLCQAATSAAVAHCPGGDSEHDHRPHFHIKFLQGNGSSAHCHDCEGCDARTECDAPGRSFSPAVAHLIAHPQQQHDSDAIYVDRIPLATSKRGADSGCDERLGEATSSTGLVVVWISLVTQAPRGMFSPDGFISLSTPTHIMQQRWLL